MTETLAIVSTIVTAGSELIQFLIVIGGVLWFTGFFDKRGLVVEAFDRDENEEDGSEV
jgi:hypothetical protein